MIHDVLNCDGSILDQFNYRLGEYGHLRWLGEIVFSLLKRMFDSSVNAVTMESIV